MKYALMVIVLAAISVTAQGKPVLATFFKVGSSTFKGTAKTVCVIQGKWANGELFRYEAWDGCKQMHIRRASKEAIRMAIPHGKAKGDAKISDIPPNAEVFEISNDYSQVLVFRDASGMQREILSGD